MKRNILGTLATVLLGALLPGNAACAVDEDSLIVPGERVGVVKLGMRAAEVKRDMGNIDGTYELPSGVRLDFAQWKEPDKTYKIRLFYKGGKVVQVSESAPIPATADGISCRSTLGEVQAKYKGLVCLPFDGPEGRVNYWADRRRGIAFAFAVEKEPAAVKKSEAADKSKENSAEALPRADAETAKNAQRLSAIVVFPANGRLIADKDERAGKVR
jgi:hypothetical protein